VVWVELSEESPEESSEEHACNIKNVILKK
jgi:hypothetical protein